MPAAASAKRPQRAPSRAIVSLPPDRGKNVQKRAKAGPPCQTRLNRPVVSSGPENPLLKPWQTPFQTPPFGEIAPEHFLPAFEQAFADHAAEVAAITHDPSAPDFANTITALERSGRLLAKVSAVFYDLVSAHSNPALLEIDKDVSLRMARHWNPIMMNAVLFGRIAQLHENRAALGLTPRTVATAGAHLHPLPPGRRRSRRGRRRRGWPRSTSGWLISAPPSATISSATNRSGSSNSAKMI